MTMGSSMRSLCELRLPAYLLRQNPKRSRSYWAAAQTTRSPVRRYHDATCSAVPSRIPQRPPRRIASRGNLDSFSRLYKSRTFAHLNTADPRVPWRPAARPFSGPARPSAPQASNTGVPSTTPAPISAEAYHELADTYLEALVEELEDTLLAERKDVDVEYSAGVLTLKLPPAGTYVLNKQPPNRQIWLSSPTSGPKRYDWVPKSGSGGGQWQYGRDGSSLTTLLEDELGLDVEELRIAEDYGPGSQ